MSKPDRQIDFDKNFVTRLRNIINKDILVSAHWEDMYAIGIKKIFIKLMKMGDEEFYSEVANQATMICIMVLEML